MAEFTVSGVIDPQTAPTNPWFWELDETLWVGGREDFYYYSYPSPDPRASVVVDGGSLLATRSLMIGAAPGWIAEMTITGHGTKVATECCGSRNGDVVVGGEGNGRLLVDDGAWLHLSDGASLQVHDRAEIRGDTTLVTLDGEIILSGLGTELVVSDGAKVRSVGGNSSNLSMYDYSRLTITGQNSVLEVDGAFEIGSEHQLLVGAGIAIENGAAFYSYSNSPSVIRYGSELSLDGGTVFNQQDLTLAGTLSGHGLVTAHKNFLLEVGQTGRIEAGVDETLGLVKRVHNEGAAFAKGGEIAFHDEYTGYEGSEITLQEGAVRFDKDHPARHAGVLVALAGLNHVHGDFESEAPGSVVVANDALLTFHNDLVSRGEVRVMGGGALLVYGDAEFESGNLFATVNSSDSPIVVLGDLNIHGQLNVGLGIALDEIEPGLSFKLAEAGGITGAFDSLDLPNLPGTLALTPEVTDTSFALRVVDLAVELPGDFNGDGSVDSADFTVWRDGLELGLYHQQDHAVWVENFGMTFASVSAASVPEPSACLMLLAATVGLPRRRALRAHS
ncbi:hypothetical protein [Pseudobythopirellula maris]|nr:hypothetical protein [Pseudobythopirellula maris]